MSSPAVLRAAAIAQWNATYTPTCNCVVQAMEIRLDHGGLAECTKCAKPIVRRSISRTLRAAAIRGEADDLERQTGIRSLRSA